MFWSLVFSIAMVAAFQVLAGSGILAATFQRGRVLWLLLLIALGFWFVDRGNGLQLLWVLGAFACGWLARMWSARGGSLWETAAVAMVPVCLASLAPWMYGPKDEFRRTLTEQVEIWAGSQVESPAPGPEGGEPSDAEMGPEARDLAEKQRALAEQAVFWMLKLLPAEIVVFNLVQVMLVLVWCGKWAVYRQEPQRLVPVTAWRISFRVVWLLIASLVLLVVRSETLRIVGMNALLIGLGLCMIQGFAVILALLERSVPKVFRWMMLLLATLTALPVLVLCAVLIGMVDLWADLRRPRMAS